MDEADDDTIRQRPGWQRSEANSVGPPFALAKAPRLIRFWLLALVLVGLTLAIIAAVLVFLPVWPMPQPPAIASLPKPHVSPPQPPAAAIDPRFVVASEADILATRSTQLTIFRLAGNPAILVFDFPTMHEQAQMLNRIAVMVETIGQPRDHPLNDGALAVAVQTIGAEPDSFYDGHDYRTADIVAFFHAAEQDGIRLNPEEIRLHDILQAAGWFGVGNTRPGALISIPTMGVGVDADARAVVLRHEISHGEYFTNPTYVEHVRRFWQNDLTAAERSGFRRFLTGQHYDPGNEDLMMNESQAYLIHTADPRFFAPAMAGLTAERGRQLRELFIAAMPAGWLRELATRPMLTPARGAR